MKERVSWVRRCSWAALLAAPLLLAGCQLFVTDEVGKGIGEACETDDDCQAATCMEGVCSVECQSTDECPTPSECLGNFCQFPLNVGIIYVGVPEDEGWTLTHGLGIDYALEALPYLKTEFVTNTFKLDDAQAVADDFIDPGDGFAADAVVANSFSLRDAMKTKAEQYPDQQFFVCAGNDSTKNYTSYFARSYQTWYLAGYAAAQISKKNRLAFMGSFVTPEVVRHINAFTRGAQRSKPNIVVEVRWEGFWFDVDPKDPVTGKYDEEEITEQLLATGCDVIGHNSDNGRTVAVVEKAHAGGATCTVDTDCPGSTCSTGKCAPAAVYSVGNDNIDACNKGPDSCIGVPYWNWGPLYVQMFDQLHKGTYTAGVINDNIQIDPVKSINNFGMNDNVLDNNIQISVAELLSKLAKDDGIGIAFQGPYCSTGQREPECVEAGQTIDDVELTTMCWFVQGVVEKADPFDPLSADVPAEVPVGQKPVPPGSATKPDCRVNQ